MALLLELKLGKLLVGDEFRGAVRNDVVSWFDGDFAMRNLGSYISSQPLNH